VGGDGKTLLILDCDPPAQSLLRSVAPGTSTVQGLALMDSHEWEPGVVEVWTPQPRLIVRSVAELGPLPRCLKACGIAVQEAGDLDPLRNALHIRELLDLPVALCHSTPGNFLSYPEGREIAVALMEEGVNLYAHEGRPLGKLPIRDPQDLLQRLKRKPGEFDRGRYLPDRAYLAALRYLLDGEAKAASEPHDRLVRMSSRTGIDLRWNWRLTQRVNHAIRVGFYRDPVELYRALQ
jgi:hypothetical protein